MKREKRLVIYAVALFLAILVLGVLMLGDFGLLFFNLLFGRRTYAIDIYCVPKADFSGGKLSSVSFSFDIRLIKEGIAVEALLTGYRVKELNGENLAVPWRLHVFVYVMNRVKLFDGWITFDDLNPKLVTIYLRNLPLEARQVYVEIEGSYTLNGEEIAFSNYGGSFPIEG